MSENKDRDGILGALVRFGALAGRNRRAHRTASSIRSRPAAGTGRASPPGRNKLVLKQLKDLSDETGISQQALVAEALNMLMAKYKQAHGGGLVGRENEMRATHVRGRATRTL
jgi:hypothetical protein